VRSQPLIIAMDGNDTVLLTLNLGLNAGRHERNRSCPRKRFRLDKHVEIQRGLSYPPRLESECRMEQALLVNVLQRVMAVCPMRRFVQSPGLGPA